MEYLAVESKPVEFKSQNLVKEVALYDRGLYVLIFPPILDLCSSEIVQDALRCPGSRPVGASSQEAESYMALHAILTVAWRFTGDLTSVVKVQEYL